MRTLGAFETPDGFFLSIYVPPHHTAEVSVTRGGTSEVTPREFREGYLQLVDENGLDVKVIVKKEDNSKVISSVFFDLENVLELCPMTSKEHFPPGYKGNTSVDPRP